MSQLTRHTLRRGSPCLDPFTIRVEADASSVVVLLSGELDLATSSELSATLDPASATGPGEVVVDLSAVTFLDTRGVGVILAAQEGLRARSVRLAVRRPSPVARRLLARLALAGLMEDGDGHGPAPSSAPASAPPGSRR